jgi:ABC-type sugar transport system ATPase subunit
MVMVRLEAVSKSFANRYAVEGVSLEIGDGEFFTMVGPSGCGKTTLLRMLAGLERPDSGEVWFGDRRVTEVAPAAREVGMVFQNYALYPHLSVHENLAFGLRVRHTPREEVRARVRDVAELLELSQLLERKPKELSGGQRQRVALGRAIMRRPQVLLMDEPLSNLDALLRERMRIELRRFHERMGITTIYVTHDQREATSMSDRLMVMNAGRIEQIGTPEEVLGQPRTAFVATFVGQPPMNVWPASMEVDGGGNARVNVGSGASWHLPGPWPADGNRPVDILLGARPHELVLASAKEVANLTATVELLERGPGDVMLLHCRHVDHQLIVAAPGDAGTPKVGEEVGLCLAPERTHIFETRTGTRLSPLTLGAALSPERGALPVGRQLPSAEVFPDGA